MSISFKKWNIVCTKCKKTFAIERVYPRCDACHEPLEIETIVKGKIDKGNIINQTILERYADFFPFIDIDRTISLHEGFTPLVESPKIAAELGLKSISFKNESQNPTWSFKDRGTVVCISHAIGQGYERIGAVSTGNMAASVAAYGAKANLETFILVSANLPTEKLIPIAVHNPILITVEGDYSQLYFQSLEVGKQNEIYFINSDVPFRVEGSKTIAYEICEQVDYDVPDFVVIPTSSGGNIRGILKGFKEFKLAGLTGKVPKMVCAQASGCSPIYTAYIRNAEVISRVENPQTIAHAIENPYPPSGNEVLRRIKENEGICVAVTDEEILQAQKQLAEVGIFGQPASAVPLASLRKLRKDGYLDENSRAICIITGSGLKDTTVLKIGNLKAINCRLESLNESIQEISFKRLAK